MLFWKWIGIIFCLTQSAMFSGLNLAYFSISKLELELEARKNNKNAIKIANLRQHANYLLATILWGNVGINVLLAMLSDSAMTGIIAFCFSTFAITFFGEIIPQAYFSRNAMKMGALLAPVMNMYQFILFPVARPSAFFLDKWLGGESISYIKERDLKQLLALQIEAAESDISKVEGRGAMNFLAIDDLSITEEGEPIDPQSILKLEFESNRPIFPFKEFSQDDPFIKHINSITKKWIVITDQNDEPRCCLETDAFIREALSDNDKFKPHQHCHIPIIIRNSHTPLGMIITELRVHPEHIDDDVIDNDVIIYWSNAEKRIITGSDILGRLLRGIVKQGTITIKPTTSPSR